MILVSDESVLITKYNIYIHMLLNNHMIESDNYLTILTRRKQSEGQASKILVTKLNFGENR